MDLSEHWFYPDYNFTLAHLWTTHLVNALGPLPTIKIPTNLTLDKPDKAWAVNIEDFDFVIISAGHWFQRPSKYYEKGKFIGCHKCGKDHATRVDIYHAYRMAFRTAFRTLLRLKKFKGVTILRTITESHVDYRGEWGEGGDCTRTRPFTKDELRLDEVVSRLYSIQVEEFRAAEREGRKRGLRFGLLSITEQMAMRPDGHPNRFGHWQHEKVSTPDCLHWCLPGPVDLWNELLPQMLLKMKS